MESLLLLRTCTYVYIYNVNMYTLLNERVHDVRYSGDCEFFHFIVFIRTSTASGGSPRIL